MSALKLPVCDATPDGFVVVQKSRLDALTSAAAGEKKEEKAGALARPILRRAPHLGRSVARGILATPTIRRTGGTSAVATLFSQTFGLKPGSAADFASFAALFDEYRVTMCRAHWSISYSAIQAGSIQTCGVLVYDPSDSSNLASVAAGVNYQQKKLFQSGAVSSSPSLPAVVTSDGLWHLDMKVHNDAFVDPSVGTTKIVHGWAPTSDSTVNFGYVHIAIDPPIAGTTVSLDIILEMTTEFRSRQ